MLGAMCRSTTSHNSKVMCCSVGCTVRFQGLEFVVFLAFFYHLDPFAIYRSIGS